MEIYRAKSSDNITNKQVDSCDSRLHERLQFENYIAACLR